MLSFMLEVEVEMCLMQSLGLMTWGNIGQGYVRMTDCCSTYTDGRWTGQKSFSRLSSKPQVDETSFDENRRRQKVARNFYSGSRVRSSNGAEISLMTISHFKPGSNLTKNKMSWRLRSKSFKWCDQIGQDKSTNCGKAQDGAKKIRKVSFVLFSLNQLLKDIYKPPWHD